MSMTVEQAKSELMQIYGMLSPDKQRAIDTVLHTIEQDPSNVREHDKDHIWYKGGQYISLRRFLKVKAEAEQEPCEDAISRQQVKSDYADWYGYGYQDNWFYKHLKDMPSVNPQEPKTGHWAHDGSYWKNRFICSECGYKLFDEPTNYCPNCGAKMESEVRNDIHRQKSI